MFRYIYKKTMLKVSNIFLFIVFYFHYFNYKIAARMFRILTAIINDRFLQLNKRISNKSN